MAEDGNEQASARQRLEIVEGLIGCHAQWGAISEAVFDASDRMDAIERLGASPFNLSEVVAEHVLDSNVGRWTALGRQSLREERDHLQRFIDGAG